MKPLVLRQSAKQDYEENFAYYLTEVGTKVAADFVQAVDIALNHITLYPETGSLRYAELLAVPTLRSWLTNRFPFILLYMDKVDKVEVIRILHQHMNISAELQDIQE